ncbi:MAG: 1-acyl-sn-glycerol-3-phosphate acyltransferase [Micrococcales bacterium]|nr:MAG: 1-acyl-sn-glycerol-3-phosphate acyltransferase [Micrococcales bacterium]PIE27947.1 MAG: 1-acyl-sn-glycerol-3-phosphate acyltransferase [Micrococcales bacterium]
MRPAFNAVFRPDVSGVHHVPDTGPVILASNHLSLSDAFFLSLVTPRKVTYLAPMDQPNSAGALGLAAHLAFKLLGQVTVNRSGEQGRSMLEVATGLLARGRALGVFPEGSRSPDGRVYQGHAGVGRLALTARVPVIPVAMHNTDAVAPVGQRVPNVAPVAVRFGPPVGIDPAADPHDAVAAQCCVERIMRAIADLAGQEYVDMTTTSRAQQLSEALRDRLAATRAAREQAKEQLRAGRERLADGIGLRRVDGESRDDATGAPGDDAPTNGVHPGEDVG